MKRKSFLFFTVMVLTVSLQDLGLFLKERSFAPLGSNFLSLRVTPNEDEDGLRLSDEKVHPFPS